MIRLKVVFCCFFRATSSREVDGRDEWFVLVERDNRRQTEPWNSAGQRYSAAHLQKQKAPQVVQQQHYISGALGGHVAITDLWVTLG